MYSEKKQVLLDKFLILYLIYQFLVVSGLCKHVQNVFYRLICLHTVQGFSHDIDGFLLVLAQQQILSSGSGFCDIDSREYSSFPDSFRSSTSSMLPVPLNSSYTTSSILLPVSTSAVARMVRLPPSRIFLAAPKKRLRHMKRRRIQTTGKCTSTWRNGQVVCPCQTCDAVEKDHDILFMFYQTLGSLDNHLGYPLVVFRQFIKCGIDNFYIVSRGSPP